MAAKATKAVVSKRVGIVLKLRIRGYTLDRITDYARLKGWGVRRAAVAVYVSRADELLRGMREIDKDKLIARHVMQRQFLFQKALKEKDYGAALGALKDEAKIECLYEKEKELPPTPSFSPLPQQVTVNQTTFINEQHNVGLDQLTFDQLRRQYRETIAASGSSEPQSLPPAIGNGDVPSGRDSLDKPLGMDG